MKSQGMTAVLHFTGREKSDTDMEFMPQFVSKLLLQPFRLRSFG